MLPKQLQNDDFRFIQLKEKAKEPISGKSWLQNLGNFYDAERWLADGYNVGVVGGYGNLRIVDLDDENYEEWAKKLPETFTTKSKRGWHLYYIIKEMSGNYLLDVGEIRANNQYCLIPGSIHPSGVEYSIVKDIPIKESDAKSILEPFGKNEKNNDNLVEVEYTGALKVIPDSIDLLIRSGATKGKRNRDRYIIVKEMFKRGFGKKDIINQIMIFNKNCRPPAGEREVQSHLVHLLRNPDKYLKDKIDKEWLKEQNYGHTEEVSITAFELMREPLPEIKYWINNLIVKESLILIGGRPSSWKSLFVLSMAIEMSKRGAFLNHFSTAGHPKVLLYDLENGMRITRMRMSYLLGKETTEETDLKNLVIKTDFDKKKIKEEMKFAENYDVIILDSYRRFLKGEENASDITDMFYKEFLKPLRDMGKTVIIIHHFKKSQLAEISEEDILEMFRGSSDIGAQVDLAYGLFKENENYEDKITSFTVSVFCAKNRLGIPFKNFAVDVEKDDVEKVTRTKFSEDVTYFSPTMRRINQIRKLLEEGSKKRNEILELFPNVSAKTVDRTIKEGLDRNLIKEADTSGWYRLPEDENTVISNY